MSVPPANDRPPTSQNTYRLPGIEREGIAQLSLLETALWPLQGGTLPEHRFDTTYEFSTAHGRKSAGVTVRAPMGLQTIDEYVLWGLLGATLSRGDPTPTLLATPFWMLRHLGLQTGGTQYTELKDALVRVAVTSYENTGFFNPESHEHEHVAFQFLSLLLPTIDGVGERIDTDRCWRIEWNPAFYRFCRMTGGNLLFDLDLHRQLTPASRRLFLKLKDRFWRSKRVFFNVDDLTIDGLGFSAARPQFKRKFDLLACIRELLSHKIIALGRGQADPKDLYIKRGKGSYVVAFYEGEYFRRTPAERAIRQKNAITDDPLYEPLRAIGIDEPGIRRLLKDFHRSLVQRWVRITDVAMHEKPRGFPGFKVSPAAFLMDGVQHKRTAPDWSYTHEKKREREQWQLEHRLPVGDELRPRYDEEKAQALQRFLASPEGQQVYQRTYAPYLAVHKLTDPHTPQRAAHAATIARIEKHDLAFPDYQTWLATYQQTVDQEA